MDKKVSFHYFYGSQADQYSFYRIPKALFQDEYFRCLSSDAKILYGLMLDRMSLSIKNQWFDEKNRAYIYFSIEDIMELLNCGRNKAIKSMQELDEENGIGLIEKKRQGFGKTNIVNINNSCKKAQFDYCASGKFRWADGSMLYCAIWIICFKKNSVFRALALSIIPSMLFLFSGIMSRSVLLIIASVLFAPSHIVISYKNVK